MPYVMSFVTTMLAISKEITDTAAPEVLAAKDVMKASSSARDTIAALEGRSVTTAKWFRTVTLTKTAVQACADLLTLEDFCLINLKAGLSDKTQKRVKADLEALRTTYNNCLAIDDAILTRLTWQRLTHYYNSISPILGIMKDAATKYLAAADSATDKAVFEIYARAAKTFCNVILDLTAPDIPTAKDRTHTDGLTMSINRQYRTPVKALKEDCIGAYERFADRTRPPSVPSEEPAPQEEATQQTFEDLPKTVAVAGSSTTVQASSTKDTSGNATAAPEVGEIDKRLRMLEAMIYRKLTEEGEGGYPGHMEGEPEITPIEIRNKAGRPIKSIPRKRYSFVLTEEQYQAVKRLLENIRGY